MRYLLILLALSSCFVSSKQQLEDLKVPPAEIKALPNSLNFLVIGDWGRKGDSNQTAVADAMASTAALLDINFVATVGDNFYLKGVKDIYDEHFKKSFEEVYHHPSLQVRWYASLGNHDYWGNVDAQIAYSQRSDRWHMPARFYAKTFESEKYGNLARLIFLDSNPLYDDYYRRHWYQKEIYGHDTSGQLAWLDSTLALDDYVWEIVIAHHHLASSGKRMGNLNQVEKHLIPILTKHRVKIYFSGHEHHMEHIRTKYGVHNFISGGGSDADFVNKKNNSVFAKSTLGYTAVSLNREKITIWLLDENNTVLHSYSREK